jgi:hypothetical protein
MDDPWSLLLQRAVPELLSVLYSTREALLHEGRKHFAALNIKALGVERLEAAQMRIERSLNALVQGKIPLRIEVQGLGRFSAAEGKEEEELLLTALRVSSTLFYIIYANYFTYL